MSQFEVCAYLFKIKSKIPDFERRKAKILTTPLKYSGTGIHTWSISRVKFEPDAEIGQISADFEMGRFEIGSKIKNNCQHCRGVPALLAELKC